MAGGEVVRLGWRVGRWLGGERIAGDRLADGGVEGGWASTVVKVGGLLTWTGCARISYPSVGVMCCVAL